MNVYVSTYGRYNNGDLSGEWVNLDDFLNYDDFIDYCYNLFLNKYKSSNEPTKDFIELMFQDYETSEEWEKNFFDECSINQNYFEIRDLINEDETYKYVIEYLCENFIELSSENLKTYYDNFGGLYDSPADYEEQILLENSNIPSNLLYYIDFNSMAKDDEMNGGISFIQIDENDKTAVFYD